MNKKIDVEQYTYNIDNETFNIYIFKNSDKRDFYIEREGYCDLYHCVGISEKDYPTDVKEFIESNLDSWIFIVMNQTEED